MALNRAPIFAETPVIGRALISTANTNRDGTGSMATLATGATGHGTRVEYLRYKATVTTTAGMIRFFIYDGVNARLWHELPVAAVTVSATVESAEGELVPTQALDLPAAYEVRVSTHNAEEFAVFAHGGNLG